MRLEGLAERLQSAGVGQIGKTIFAYFMPENVERGVLLRVGLDGATIDHELPGYRPDATFQLIVRSKAYGDGFDLIEQAVATLTMPAEEKIGAYRFNFCRPRHEPIVYPRGAGAGLEFSVNFDANYVVL